MAYRTNGLVSSALNGDWGIEEIPEVQIGQEYFDNCPSVREAKAKVDAIRTQFRAAAKAYDVAPSSDVYSMGKELRSQLSTATAELTKALQSCVYWYESNREKIAADRKAEQDRIAADRKAEQDRVAAEEKRRSAEDQSRRDDAVRAAKEILSKTYSRKSSEAEVIALQNLLNTGGCNLTVDGKWGPATSSALTKSRQYGTCAKAPKSSGYVAPPPQPIIEAPEVVVTEEPTVSKAGFFGLSTPVLIGAAAVLGVGALAFFAKKSGR